MQIILQRMIITTLTNNILVEQIIFFFSDLGYFIAISHIIEQKIKKRKKKGK